VRYLGILALLVVLAVAATMTVQGMKHTLPSGSGDSTYERAVGAANKVSDTSVQHVQDVLHNINTTPSTP
jgi:biopolymer transport protein ExbD